MSSENPEKPDTCGAKAAERPARLGSFDARLHATLEARHAMCANRWPDRAKLGAIACGLDPWKGTDEPVLVHRTSDTRSRKVADA